MRWRVAGDMFIRVRFLCFPVFTDRIGKTICGSHCQTLWDSRRETIYWLTYFFLSFYFHYLLLHAFFVCVFGKLSHFSFGMMQCINKVNKSKVIPMNEIS